MSFDGLAQNLSRKRGSFETIESNLLKILRYPKISIETNSVFTPETIDRFANSIIYLIELGVPNIRYSLSTITPWDQADIERIKSELGRLKQYSNNHYNNYGSIPVVNFRNNEKKGIFYCSAGQGRLAISAEGNIWGCHLFADYFEGSKNTAEYQKYCFGNLKQFKKKPETIYQETIANYKKLSMDNFSTSKMECFLCEYLERCSVCPIKIAMSEGSLMKIPRHICEIQRLYSDFKYHEN